MCDSPIKRVVIIYYMVLKTLILFFFQRNVAAKTGLKTYVPFLKGGARLFNSYKPGVPFVGHGQTV